MPSSDVILHLQPGPAAPNAAVKQAKGSHGRQVMKVRTPGGRGGAEAQKASPGQVKQASSASDQMAAAMKLLSETVSQAMMGGVSRPMTTGQVQGVRIKVLTKSIINVIFITFTILGSGRYQNTGRRCNYQSYRE